MDWEVTARGIQRPFDGTACHITVFDSYLTLKTETELDIPFVIHMWAPSNERPLGEDPVANGLPVTSEPSGLNTETEFEFEFVTQT